MVDTGAESTWINATVLDALGIERRQKDIQFQLANGQVITRSVGYAVLTVNKSETVDEVVFAESGDLQLHGARALDGLNLQVDARRKKLVAAGPIVSAAAVTPRFGRLVQVPPGGRISRWPARPVGSQRILAMTERIFPPWKMYQNKDNAAF
jgi:predicted aspartyl protease